MMSITAMSLSETAVCCFVIISVYQVILVVYRLFFSPLAKFPGPKLAAATGWYETFFDLWGNNFPAVLADMHKKAGPIVRVNPRELSINDPDYYNEVFVTAGRRRTNYNPGPRAALGMRDSIANTADHDLHEMRRKTVAGYFSRPNVSQLECRIHEEAKILDTRLREVEGTGKIVALDHAFSAFTGDLVAWFTCGESPKFIEGADFTPHWHISLMGVLRVVPLMRNLGWLSVLFNAIPVEYLRGGVAGFRTFALMSNSSILRVKSELEREKKHGQNESKSSVFHDLLRSDIPASEKATARLECEAFGLLAAGTITTSATLSMVTYHVLANPDIKAKLQQELGGVIPHGSQTVPSWAELERLTYLRGCIKEGLRIGRFFRRNVRISPDVALQYKGWTIPKNTPVGMSIGPMLMDSEVYPNPHEFIPERWIGEYDPRMDRNFVPFTKGGRNCLGINFAYAEIYVCLATIFRPGVYEMSLVGTDESDMELVFDSDVGVPKRDSRGLNVRFD